MSVCCNVWIECAIRAPDTEDYFCGEVVVVRDELLGIRAEKAVPVVSERAATIGPEYFLGLGGRDDLNVFVGWDSLVPFSWAV